MDGIFIKTYEVLKCGYHKIRICGLQPISRDTDNNAAMYNYWWTNIGANINERSYQHGGDDVT